MTRFFTIDKIAKIIIQRDKSLTPSLLIGIKEYINNIFYNIKPLSFNYDSTKLETEHDACIRFFYYQKLV